MMSKISLQLPLKIFHLQYTQASKLESYLVSPIIITPAPKPTPTHTYPSSTLTSRPTHPTMGPCVHTCACAVGARVCWR